MYPRLGDEAQNFIMFVVQNFPAPKGFELKTMRERSENIHMKINEKLSATFKGTEEERQIKVDETTEIPITIYTPLDAKKDKMVVYFHGGGWTIASRKTHQTIVNMLADATKTVWISVEYRLAPEHKFPIWLDDACEVTRQILANKSAYGGDENTKVGVAGDSAGGLIAASICHTIKNLDFQILIYGAFDFAAETESHKEFTRPEHILTPTLFNWFKSNALRDENDMKNPRASVLLNESFDNVPPCLFIVAELDPLRDDSYEYQKKLEKSGIKTNLVLIKNAIHSFFSLPGIFEKACGQGIEAVTEFMNGL
jgi:acetyl esterase